MQKWIFNIRKSIFKVKNSFSKNDCYFHILENEIKVLEY